MLKKTITFTDYNDEIRTEDFYFNLSKAELTALQLSHKGGFKEFLERVVEAEDGKAIMDTFKDIIGMSVGMRSDDGRRFIKSDKITEDFLSTEAYSELFMELVTDANAASAFVNALVPQNLGESTKTSSDEVRRRSEAQLQGRLEKKAPEVETVREEIVDVDMDRKIQEGVEAALRAKAASTQGYQSQNFQ